MTTTIGKQQRRDEFSSEFYRMSKKVRCIFRAKGRSEDYIADNEDHAMCWAWTIFVRLSEQHPDWDARGRCSCAAKYGAMNVLEGRQFVQTRERGYIDALDSRARPVGYSQYVDSFRLSVEVRERQRHLVGDGRDPARFDDETGLLAIVETLPKRLQAVATCLGRGMTKAAIARELGLGVSTVWLKRQQIGEWLLKGRLEKTGH